MCNMFSMRREKGIESVFEEITTKNFPNLKNKISRYRKRRGS